MKYKTALVIGGGAFGTSIGHVLAENFERVILKVRSQDLYECLQKGENSLYLPGQKLSQNMMPAMSFEEVEKLKVGEIELVVSGLPTEGLRTFCETDKEQIEAFLKKGIPFVSLSKGIDTSRLELPDDIFYDYFSPYRDLFTFLSGPTFAREIVQKQITVASLAGRSKQVLEQVSEMMHTSYFKAFATYDVKGVLLGGALKNILAIAGGIIEGLGFNHNTRAAMITRGIVEMLRFGVVFNARTETFYGLSGMGDLILTTTGDLSRNKVFGMEIAKGRRPLEIIESKRSVVEGYKTAKSTYYLAKKYGLHCTIFNGVYRVLYENAAPQEVIQEIMNTPPRFEVTY